MADLLLIKKYKLKTIKSNIAKNVLFPFFLSLNGVENMTRVNKKLLHDN